MQVPGDEGGGGRPPPLVPPRAPAAGRKRSREEIDGEALLAAANQNNTAAIRELVGQRGVPVDWCIKGTGGGQTPLHLASFNANGEAIQLLLELGASINMANDISGATPLHLAAMGKGTRPRKLEAIAALVAAGADCFMPDRYGSQPWHYAHDEEARLLMKGPEFKLHQAVLNKDLAALGGLLRGTEAAQVNALGPDGNTPLHIAACVRCTEAVRMLLTAGANPNELNEHGATPLHTAVTVVAEDVVDVLIAAGATIDAKSILVYEYNSRGINWVEPGEGTPQSSPKSLGAPGSAGSFGAGPSPRNRREYRRRESNSSSDGEGGGGDERTFEDKTPLHLAVATKNGLEMTRLLLTKGADPNATDAKGRTCLHLALDRLLEVSPMGIPGDTEACLALIRLLLEKRADPLRPHPAAGAGQSLLHSCVQAGHVDALETVLGHTFGSVRRRLLDGQDALGMTPLMLSAQANKVGCLESLLRNGADASIASASGDTARALAERLGHTAAVCILDTFSSFAGVA